MGSKKLPAKSVIAPLSLAVCLVLAACAPSAEPSKGDGAGSEDAASDAITVTWSPESDCGTCHVLESSSQASAPCAAFANGELGCMSCHDDEETLAKRHEGMENKTPATRLKKTDVGEGVCLGCHDGYEVLSTLTADVAIVDKAGTAVNPHEAANMTEGHAGVVICSECHSMHDGKTAIESANAFCTGCHHEGLFECGTCHSH